ncbi:MAG: hypothetical protein IT433_06605 [Phycisphaerales bacterium]|nr:hypothetical protein [Phycisphaerales bacterium]
MARVIDSQQAGRQALVAQAACALAIVAGLGVVAVGLPGGIDRTSPSTLTLPEVAVTPTGTGPAATTRPVDEAGIDARLARFSNAPRVTAPVVVNTNDGQPAPSPSAESKYLGPVALGPRLLALMSIQGKQRFVKVGDQLPDESRVEEITPTEVVTEGPLGRKTYELAARSGQVLTHAPIGAGGKGGIPRTAAPPAPVPPVTAAAVNSALAGNSKARPVRRRPGDADGSPERFQEIVDQVKKSGGGETSEDDLMQKAKAVFEEETIRASESKATEKGGKQ